MAYNKFTIVQLKTRFGLQITEQKALFAETLPVEISRRLREQLTEDASLALRGNSEKARAEYIIAPILADVYHKAQDRANLFSGTEFNVDPKQGLAGFCDFLFTLVPRSIEIEAPIVSIVEAKKEDIPKGIPQCLAELVAAQIFNANAGQPIATLYGAVTTGEIWKFMCLTGTQATVDGDTYYLDNVEKIVGILLAMLNNPL